VSATPGSGSASPVRVGIVDTGVNPWHSHVRGRVAGCRVFLGEDGAIREDGDFRDPVGHGTAVAGLVREELPEAEIFAIRVFDGPGTTYPSLVARGVLRAALAGCRVVNLSLWLEPGPASELLAEACQAAREAGCLLVAPAHPEAPGRLPAALPGVVNAVVDDELPFGEVHRLGPLRFAAPGRPRDLGDLPREANLWGASFACARVAAQLARRIPAPDR